MTEQNEQGQNGSGLFLLGALLLVVALALFFPRIFQVLLVFFAGVLAAILVHIPADWLKAHTPLTSQVAVIIVIVLLIVSIALTSWLIRPSIAKQLDALAETVPNALDQIEAWLRSSPVAQQLYDETQALSDLNVESLLVGVGGAFSDLLGFGVYLLITPLIGFYLALNPQIYTRGVIGLLPKSKRARAREVLHAVGQSLKWWLVGRLFAMVVLGLLIGLGLELLGVPLALILGVITGLFSFVPAIGSILAASVAALVAITQGPSTLLVVMLVYAGAQMIETYFLTPMVQQYTVSLPPALALLVQLALSLVAGGFGVALAFPLATVALVLVKMLYVEDVLGEEISLPGIS